MIATAKRSAILKGDAGIAKKKKDIIFDKAAEEFLAWTRANKRPKTTTGYESIMKRLKESFGGKMLSEIHPFLIEKYKQKRLADGVKVPRVPEPEVFMTRGRAKDGQWKPYRSFRTAFETAVRNVKLSGVTPHVLRHTFASRLMMRGADLRTVQELGGWKSLNMVQRYAHLSQEHKRQAIELLAENSPSLITTAHSAKPVTPCAPIAQVDRASAF